MVRRVLVALVPGGWVEGGGSPPPPPSQARRGGQGVPPPPPVGGSCFHCSFPLMVTKPVAEVPPPLATDDAPAVESPGSSTLVSRTKASLQARRSFPASSGAMVQLSV